jgi:hypothetical protein
MGQRLNIEIKKKGNVLANSYYHWSAYTSTASSLTVKVCKYLLDHSDISDSRLLAIRALESTGAGLNDEELAYAKNFRKYVKTEFKECKGRNEGLIAISPKGIKETQDWSEGDVIIDIDNACQPLISFHVFNFYDQPDEYIKDWLSTPEEIKQFKDNLVKIPFNEVGMSFTEFQEFLRYINDGKFIVTPAGYMLSSIE